VCRKQVVFTSLGYTIDDSAELVRIYELQASAKYSRGDYAFGKSDNWGQRISIVIDLPSKGSSASRIDKIISGWMIQPDGITLNTPFGGYSK
jgi:filamentous hemagglutinin